MRSLRRYENLKKGGNTFGREETNAGYRSSWLMNLKHKVRRKTLRTLKPNWRHRNHLERQNLSMNWQKGREYN